MNSHSPVTPLQATAILIVLFVGISALLFSGLQFPKNTAAPRITLATTTPATELLLLTMPTTTIAKQKPVVKKVPRVTQSTHRYVEITEGCTQLGSPTCVNIRSGPGTNYGVVNTARIGMVLRTDKTVQSEGRYWYHVAKDSWLRYPERANSHWYVASDFVQEFTSTEAQGYTRGNTDSKYIIVDRSTQTLYAYENKRLFMSAVVSTGLKATPTPLGTFHIYKKTPSRYMQGPITGISTSYYDLPGVPWNLYFTEQGAIIHGAYWHNSFGKPHSNGCVNLPVATAEKLYAWADVGTPVIVRQ